MYPFYWLLSLPPSSFHELKHMKSQILMRGLSTLFFTRNMVPETGGNSQWASILHNVFYKKSSVQEATFTSLLKYFTINNLAIAKVSFVWLYSFLKSNLETFIFTPCPNCWQSRRKVYSLGILIYILAWKKQNIFHSKSRKLELLDSGKILSLMVMVMVYILKLPKRAKRLIWWHYLIFNFKSNNNYTIVVNFPP